MGDADRRRTSGSELDAAQRVRAAGARELPLGLGLEWVIDASGCDPARLRDSAHARAFLSWLMEALSLTAAAPPLLHAFPGEGGLTAMVLLTESHLAIHTFPEHRALTLNLYCCKARPALAWSNALAEWFGAGHVSLRELVREARR